MRASSSITQRGGWPPLLARVAIGRLGGPIAAQANHGLRVEVVR